MLRGHLRYFISLSIFFSLVFSSLEANSNCISLLSGIREAKPIDWEHKDRSLLAVAANSVIWLSGVESIRLLSNASAFGTAFIANTSIDVILTALSHQISLGNVPASFKKLLEGKQNYKRRALINTSMAMSVLLPIWAISAAASGAEIQSFEAWAQAEVIHPAGPALALGMLYSAYRIAPYIKKFFFQDIPLRADQKEWNELQTQFPEQMSQLEHIARDRARELNLETEIFEKLVMSLVEVVRLRIPYEERLSEELLANRSISNIADKISKSESELEKSRLRKKLIQKLIKLYDSGLHQNSVNETLSLGEPFDSHSSLALHRYLNKRSWKKTLRLAVTAFIDQSFWVGFLGGVVLRGITGFALGT